MTHRILRAMSFLALLAACTSVATAQQLSLNINSIDTSQFPTVRVKVTTKSGAILRKDFDSSKYVFREDGFRQMNVQKVCPAGSTPFSIAIVIGSGSSTSAGDVSLAVGIASQLVDSLNGFSDEAAIVAYNTVALPVQSMSPYKPMLQTALSTISAYPTAANHFYDGVFMGVQEATMGNNIRSVLVLSNAIDDGSQHNLNDVITLANSGSVKIFTLGINAGGSNSTLQSLATQTGGRYFGSAEEAIQTIVNSQRGNPDWCEFTYVTDNTCRDGLARTLDVTLRSGSDSATTSQQWTVGPNPTMLSAPFAVATRTVTSGNSVIVPFELKQAVAGLRFWPATLALAYNRAALSLVDIKTDSTVAAGLTASFVENATGATVTISNGAVLTSAGAVLRLVFRGETVTADTPVQVVPSSLTFSRGCITPQLTPGIVTVRPKSYAVSGTSTPRIFTWNASACAYDPSPSKLSIEVTNTGDLPLTGLTATLPSDPAFKPAGGYGATVAITPSSLAPGQKGTAEWIVRLTPRDSEASLQVDAAIAAVEPVTGSVRMYVNVKAAGATVALASTADTVRVSGGVYTPDPAVVRATVRAAGNGTGPAGTAIIEVPAPLWLDGAPASQAWSDLAAGTSTTISWPIRYPKNLTRDTTYDILVRTTGTCPATDTVKIRLHIPVEMASRLSAGCLAKPASVAYDTVARAWPTITVWSRVHNTGLAASDSVFALLAPGAPLELLPTESARKLVSASIAAGDSARVEWQVRVLATHVACSEQTASINYNVSSAGQTIFDCPGSMLILEQPNLSPEVTARVPASLDSVFLGRQAAFSVTAVDADGDALTYQWNLDGQPVGSNKNTYDQIFGQKGPKVLTCVITDRCVQDPVTVRWDFRVVDTSTVAVGDVPRPGTLAIAGNYPNPFNPGTVIMITVPATREIVLDVVDAAGRVVATLLRGVVAGGPHAVTFDASALPSGVYTARLRSGSAVATHQMILAK